MAWEYGGKSDEDVSDSFVGKIGEILEPDVRGKLMRILKAVQMMERMRKVLWDMHVKGLRKVLVRFYGGHEEYSRALHEGLRKFWWCETICDIGHVCCNCWKR